MVEFRSLKPEEYEKWLDHVNFVFTNSKTQPDMRDYFIRHFENDPWRDFKNILVAVEDDEILSTIKIINREFFVEDQLLRFGGIAEVSTKPEHQGKGYSGILLKMAIKNMEDQKFDVSMLSAGVPLYYSKYGWNKVIMPMKTVSIDNSGYSSLNFRKADLPADIHMIAGIWDSYRRRFNGIVNRNQEYWNTWFAAECAESYLAMTPEGETVAYACIEKFNDEMIFLKEFGCKEGFDDVFEPLSAFAVKEYDLRNNTKTEKIRMFSGVISKPDNIIETTVYENMMVRLMKPFKFGDKYINDSAEAAELLQGPGPASKYLEWGTDSF